MYLSAFCCFENRRERENATTVCWLAFQMPVMNDQTRAKDRSSNPVQYLHISGRNPATGTVSLASQGLPLQETVVKSWRQEVFIYIHLILNFLPLCIFECTSPYTSPFYFVDTKNWEKFENMFLKIPASSEIKTNHLSNFLKFMLLERDTEPESSSFTASPGKCPPWPDSLKPRGRHSKQVSLGGCDKRPDQLSHCLLALS